jgi:hypothetical protein
VVKSLQMNEFLQKHLESVGLITIGSLSISYGLIIFIPFLQSLAILWPLAIMAYIFYNKKNSANSKQEELNKLAEAIIEEQESVIVEYEKIFDSQLVELPCVCGGNTFQGLISPTLENIVECENCKNKYKVEVSFNSVLISEPLNLNKTFEDLVTESVN